MKRLFNELSIKSRLIIMLIIVTVISSAIVGLLGWQNGRNALNASITNHLKSIRSLQAHQVEVYFKQTYSHVRTLARDRMVVNAMNQFQEGYNNGLYKSLSDDQENTVSAFYDDEFVPKIAASSTNTPLSILYQPSRAAARYFQYHYIVNNPYPVNEKDGLVESKQDSTIYNRFHKFYHPIFSGLQKEFSYHDIFLIDIESLSIVYSVFKEVDFATSLQNGPYQESGLGLLVNQIKESPERDLVSITDFRPYAPSYGAPAAFVGAPIFNRNEAVGILVVQLPATELNKVMTANEQWQSNGLGTTGESYLVGSDRLMRSVARLFVEDKETYIEAIEEYGLAESTIKRIKTFDTTLLLQPVTSASVQNAFADQTGTQISTNYLGNRVLSSFSPLNIAGLNWAIVSEMTEEEAFGPIAILQRNILIWGVVLVMCVAFMAILLSRYFVRPIEKLTAGVRELSAGRSLAEIDMPNNDEFGELAHQFNVMNQNIHKKTQALEEKKLQNAELLSNILPLQFHERLQTSEQVSDQHQQVTIMQLELDGFGSVSAQLGVHRAALALQNILDQLDESAERYDVQSVNSVGTAYTAVCGLNNARLDHAKRTLDFSITALQIIKNFNNDNQFALQVRIGVDSGTVSSGVIGTKKIRFGLWGDTVDTARMIRNQAQENTILVTDDVYQRVREHYDFRDQHSAQPREQSLVTYELLMDALTHKPVVQESVQ